jgi:hypothetical protein
MKNNDLKNEDQVLKKINLKYLFKVILRAQDQGLKGKNSYQCLFQD